jgi:hypothetical protein
MFQSVIFDRVDSISDLGVIMDNRMSFAEHVDIVITLSIINIFSIISLTTSIMKHGFYYQIKTATKSLLYNTPTS